MGPVNICPNCGRPLGGASVCADCGYSAGQAAIHTSYPKVYRIPEDTQHMVSMAYAVFGVGGSVCLGIVFYRSGATPGLIAALVGVMLVATAWVAWGTSGLDKSTSITMYEDHVEWMQGRKTASCSNHELTIMFGQRPQFNQSDAVGPRKDIRFGRDGGPYMWAWRDFENYGELVAELQRRSRQ